MRRSCFAILILMLWHIDIFAINTAVTPIMGDPHPILRFKEIPVIDINVYVMCRDEIEREVALAIGENIDFLNQEFAGQIKFNLKQLFLDPSVAFLPELRQNYFSDRSHEVDNLLQPIEQNGAVNVFVFNTYIEEGKNVALTGFTPRLRKKQETYANNSPRFDRIFISFEGLFDKTTLIHEMGHFLGLQHPWEMSTSEKFFFGMKSLTKEKSNHMSYGSDVKEFTMQQIDAMQKHALRYRRYLLSNIEYIYERT